MADVVSNMHPGAIVYGPPAESRASELPCKTLPHPLEIWNPFWNQIIWRSAKQPNVKGNAPSSFLHLGVPPPCCNGDRWQAGTDANIIRWPVRIYSGGIKNFVAKPSCSVCPTVVKTNLLFSISLLRFPPSLIVWAKMLVLRKVRRLPCRRPRLIPPAPWSLHVLHFATETSQTLLRITKLRL